ncbi:MAG: putative YccA/Bax inhibitor family protein [Myxococcota bacterium]
MWSPYTAPVYALLEGLFLGGISAIFETIYPGIVLQAVFLTLGTLGGSHD